MTRAEIIAEAVACYGQESASVIGARLGLTRNAVIGIWHRSRKAGHLVEMPRERRIELHEDGLSRAAAEPVEVVEVAEPPPRIIDPISPVLAHLSGAARATLEADRPARTCRWPIGDPRDDDFRFCGEVIENPIVVDREGQSRVQPYCEACRGRAFQPRADRFRPAVLAHVAFSAPRSVKPGALRFGRGA